MGDFNELLHSDELRNAAAAIDALLARYKLPRRPAGKRRFKELALGNTFQAREVLEIILSDEPAYPGLREVLAAGFVGWVLFPTRREMRVQLMIQAVMEHMDDAERAAGLVDEPLDFTRDIIARYVFTGADFLTDIYHELGGYEAFTRALNIPALVALFDEHAKAIDTTARALAYLHHGADQFEDPEYDFAPSLNRAITIFAELKKRELASYKSKFVSRSLLHTRWTKNKQTLALVYAASTIKVNKKTLLQVMLDGKFTYYQHSKFLHSWIARARYVSEYIFEKMGDPKLKKETVRLLPDPSPQSFDAPVLTASEAAAMESQFRKRFRKKSM